MYPEHLVDYAQCSAALAQITSVPVIGAFSMGLTVIVVTI